jgi:hypothetical protein
MKNPKSEVPGTLPRSGFACRNPNQVRSPESATQWRSRTPSRKRLWSLLLALPILSGILHLRAQTATWMEITSAMSPAFAHHDMTYDSLRHRLIVAGRTAPWLDEFVAWAGAADGTWTQLPAPIPPPPGDDVEVAYDSHRDRVVLYTTATNKVWEFDGTNWMVITAATTPIQCADGAQMQYDPVRRKTVLIGANGWPGPNEETASETWLWDGTDWTLAASTSTSPTNGAGGGLAFDAAHGEMVLLTMNTMQTWTFDGTNWTKRTPATTPSPEVWAFDMAFHPPSGLVIFYGGEHIVGVDPWSTTYPTNTWAWDGNDWRKLEPPSTPPANIDYAFAHFPERGGLVMHGGWGDPDWNPRADVWLLALQTASQPTIRFTDLRVVTTNLSLVSTGQVQTGAVQILQASTNLVITNAWANVQTNPAPAATNAWLVPRQGDQRFFRILERP